MKGKIGLRIILNTIILVLVISTIFFTFMFFKEKKEFKEGQNIYKTIARNNAINLSDKGIQRNEKAKKDIFKELKLINEDIVGWIASNDRRIDYPIVLGKDNSYYLTHLFTKESNKLGAIFLDYRNSGDLSDKSTVIYGHNTRDGAMFSSLLNYKKQSYFDENPTLTIYTPKKQYLLELYAGYVVSGDNEFVKFTFRDSKDFFEYIERLRKNSTFYSNVEIKEEDRLVTLSTCTDDFFNARYAVIGRLIEK